MFSLDPSVIIRVVRLHIQDTKVTEFLRTFESVRKDIVSLSGCRGLELWKDIDRNNIFYTYSIWDDQQALENYRNSDLFRENWSQVKPLFQERANAWSAHRYKTKTEQ